MVLCRIDDEADKSDIILQDQAADTLMAFLPGIVTGLLEIAIGGEIQNHKITVVIYTIMQQYNDSLPTTYYDEYKMP